MLQTARPSCGTDDHVEMAVPSLVGEVKMVSPSSTLVLNTLTPSPSPVPARLALLVRFLFSP